MGFALFLFFLALTYTRPIEAFAPELVVYRPMLILLLLTFFAAFGRALRTREMAATGQHVRLLIGFALVLAISVVTTGWAGGAIYALIDFAPSMLMFLSTVMLVTTPKRLTTPSLKDLPTMEESGLKGFEVTIWHGLYAPKGTSADVLSKISSALKTALKDPEFVKKQQALGAVVVTDKRIEPAEHRKFVQAEIDKWGPIIKAAGVYAD